MKLNKKDILEKLQKSNINNCTIINVVTFSTEIVIDVNISNPTLKAKKTAESEIIECLNLDADSKYSIKINFKTISTNQDSKSIEAPKISGIKNIIAIASGKGGVGKIYSNLKYCGNIGKYGF